MEYFKNIQNQILVYREKLEKNNAIIDKTNLMFLNMILDILHYLASEDSAKLDKECQYNILTMRSEFENIIFGEATNEKAQAVLLTFFLRIAKEIEIRNGAIENEHLRKLFQTMTSKDFKYPSYISAQKDFALEKMPSNIKRMELLG